MNFQSARRKFAFSLAPFVALALSLFVSVPVHAQVAGATLSGTVADASGGAIPNTKVSIKNTATGIIREATTDSAGLYSAPNLQPGVYQVEISAAGFGTEVLTGITLTVGGLQTVDAILKVGQVTQTINVSTAAPTVELTSSTISGVVEATTVRELPLNSRDWTALATLQPGVLSVRAQAASNNSGARGNRGFGNQIVGSGHRPNENNYRINGISINDYSNSSPGSVLGLIPGVDSIEEFSVVSDYTTEYGRSSGSVVNAIGKSGTNQLHGVAYGFLREQSLNAKNFFDNPKLPIPAFHRYLFGIAAGGPIRKDKIFVFANYEGIRDSESQTLRNFVPSQNARNGILVGSGPALTSCPAGTTLFVPGQSNVCVNNLVIPFLPIYPLPNSGAVGNGNTGVWTGTGVLSVHENYFTVKVDDKLSQKDSLSGSYFFDDAPDTIPDAYLFSLNRNLTRRQMAGLEETHIFSPTVVNTVRAGLNRETALIGNPLHALNPLAIDPALAAIPGEFVPTLVVPSLTTFNGGLGSVSVYNHHWTTIQLYDDAFFTKGDHSLKFGFAFEHMQHDMITKLFFNGMFTFPSLQGFLTNTPTNVQLLNPNFPVQEVGTRESLFGGYLQDDWRVRPNLTLNLGMRYEMTTLPSDAHNRFQVIQDIYGGLPVPVTHPFQSNPTLRNFEPRVGFSWDPFKNGKTAVRGGFGMFDILPLPYLTTQQAATTYPFETTAVLSPLPPGSFPTGAFDLIVPFNIHQVLARYTDQHPHRSYTMNWNLNIQRQLGWKTSVMIGYLGSRSVHLPRATDDANMVQVPFNSAAEGYLWPCDPTRLPAKTCTGGGTKVDPNVGAIRAIFFDGNGYYNGLQAQIKKGLGHGIQAQASYTWGKCIDTSSSPMIGNFFLNSAQAMVWFDPAYMRGFCDYDVRHNFVANYIWNLPQPKSFKEAAAAVLGGWQLGGIITVSSGTPFSVNISGDPLGQGASSNLLDYPNRLPGCNPIHSGSVNHYINASCFALPVAPAAIPASECQAFVGTGTPANPQFVGTCQNLLGTSGRNQFYGPNLAVVDFSVFKNNYIRRISESFNVQFRAEFFNVLNHPNFLPPINNRFIFSQSGSPVNGVGAIDSTSTPSRQIQFGLKVIW